MNNVSTDSRTLQPGDVFFALIGETHDAHDHLAEVAAKGASKMVVSDASKVPADFAGEVAVVGDTLRAYQDAAAAWLHEVDPFVIAITGSVGKTTLKDMIACICAKALKTHATQGNFNNQIGVPKTILSMPADTEVLVLEMGMEWPGEIKRLCEIARPNACAITNVGVSHREHFDSDDGIRLAKYEIASFLGAGDALVIDPNNDAGLVALAEAGAREQGFSLVKIGEDYRVRDIRYTEDGALTCEICEETREEGECERFALPIPGAYAATSAAMAAAICLRLGISIAAAAEALRTLTVTPHRLQPIRKGGVLVIDDTYNASPDSMRSGLEYLSACPGARKIAVLADMNELGAESERLHFETGRLAAALGVRDVYTYGDKARKIAGGADRADLWFSEKPALVARLLADVQDGDVVFVKGSRSLRMEEVVEALLA
ncbi:MAG: UDP-N-acetylmuramoyl-tripeptide--D-alanyl-D-alanine ligase [Clostridiales Family XIII bacterium]|jgi:UDP-N-acetylmuramoyl-tripeptide--D-alanyl-D-alanine ligase|nr:UDP-N-acetylmuramoyl-tripeptide--D-alanyl-D-alanine ligase [Clostridiales Family XIII bacterium]